MLYRPIKYKNLDSSEVIKKNWERLEKCDRMAKEKGELKGRYIIEVFADVRAVYQIIKVNKKTVRIRFCTGLGYDSIIPYWGEEATIDKEYAIQQIEEREDMEEFLSLLDEYYKLLKKKNSLNSDSDY